MLENGWTCWMLAVFLILMLPVMGTGARAESIVDAVPVCSVTVNGQRVKTIYETAVCHQRYWSAEPELHTTPVAIHVGEPGYEVEIDYADMEVTSAMVRPLSLGIEPEIRQGRICFTVPNAAKLTVEINGSVEEALHLFLDRPDEDRPDPEGAKVQYFGPGVHRDVMVTVGNRETIYLDEGCVLYGQIFCGLGSNFTIAGHGVLCGSIYDRYKDTLVPLSLTNCSDFTIRDITILDPSAWTLNLLKCRRGTIDNVKIVSCRSNSDGITMQNCEDMEVRNCFVRSWDDSLVLKGYNGDVKNITYEDCILWTDLAQSCEIGYETRGKVIENIAYRNITVLHNFHKPVLSIHNSDQAKVRNVSYEHIVVEDAQMGEGDGEPYLIDLTTTESQWSVSVRRGTIENVEIRDVTVLSGKRPSIRIWSHDEDSRIDHVHMQGLNILGESISDLEQIRYLANPWNGEDIRIE